MSKIVMTKKDFADLISAKAAQELILLVLFLLVLLQALY